MKLDPTLRADVLAQIKRRASVQFNWDPNDPDNNAKTERLWRLAIERARHHHRHHDRENLPALEGTQPIDARMQIELDWQASGTLKLIQHEHHMTLEAYFTAVGVRGDCASKVVEYLIAKDKAMSED